MELTNDKTKIDLVERLVKDGAIDFSEAIKLLEKEVHIIDLTPNYNPYPWKPYPIIPFWQVFPDQIQYNTQCLS